jgi:hypothetical protein
LVFLKLQTPFFSGFGGYFLILEEISCCVLEINKSIKNGKNKSSIWSRFFFSFINKFCDIKFLVNVLDKIAK